MPRTLDRRRFVTSTLAVWAGASVWPATARPVRSGPVAGSGRFFTVGQRAGRWWLVAPDGEHTFSLGMNHVDPAALRFAASEGLWNSSYGNRMDRWLAKVKEDLTGWGFNCLGWEQEVVIVQPEMHRHSRSFTFEEYQWLDMPYFHLLPIIESHQWEVETRLPDIKGPAFAEWCDYVARDRCARMRDDPKLVGYFFTDCPTWIHSNEGTAWKAPLLEPEMENTESGRREIFETATVYYRTVVEAIRRYDPHHLICGDRYEANAPLSQEVVRAAQPYVDVFSFQCFGTVDNIRRKLSRWAGFLKRPVLLADSMINAEGARGWPPQKDRTQDAEQYAEILRTLRGIPECIGFHLCGAYVKNNARRYGLLNAVDREEPTTQGIRTANLEQARWAREATATHDEP